MLYCPTLKYSSHFIVAMCRLPNGHTLIHFAISIQKVAKCWSLWKKMLYFCLSPPSFPKLSNKVQSVLTTLYCKFSMFNTFWRKRNKPFVAPSIVQSLALFVFYLCCSLNNGDVTLKVLSQYEKSLFGGLL